MKPYCDGTPCRKELLWSQRSEQGVRQARWLQRPADRDSRQSRHLCSLGLLYRSAGFGIPSRARPIHYPERWKTGRNNSGRPGVPVRRPQLRHRAVWRPAIRSIRIDRRRLKFPKTALPDNGRHSTGRRGWPRHAPSRRFFAGAFQPVPVRTLSKQAILQWDALVYKVRGSRPRLGTPTNAF